MFCIKNNIEWVALSFVRTSQDILDFTAYVANLSEDKIIGIPGGMHHLFIDEPLLFIEKLKNILV